MPLQRTHHPWLTLTSAPVAYHQAPLGFVVRRNERMFHLTKTLRTLPGRIHWLETFALAVLICALGALIAPELLNTSNSPPMSEMLLIAVVAFFIPAALEEIVFRGLLLPQPTLTWISISTACFIAWHPLEAWLFFPDASEIFLNPKFLACVGALGLACCWTRYRSNSLWTSITLHWSVVVMWKAAGGIRNVV